MTCRPAYLRPLPANRSCSSMPIPDDSSPIFMFVLLTKRLVLLEPIQRIFMREQGRKEPRAIFQQQRQWYISR